MPRMAGLLGLWVCVTGCVTNYGYDPLPPAVVPPDRVGTTIVAPVGSVPQTPLAVQPDGTVLPGTVGAIPVANSTTPEKDARLPDLGGIYGQNAAAAGAERNPLIVIPGVLGSRLVDDATQRVVWGEFGGDGIDASSAGGARLLALPMAEGRPLRELNDTVHVQGVLDTLEIRVFGLPFELSAYRDILVALGVGGYHEYTANGPSGRIGNNSFQFAYDWRRDNVENAQRLHQFILGKKAELEQARRKQYGDNAPPVRFDIVAHSMGGLVARYYLQYGDADLPADGSTPNLTWAGAQYVDRVVLIGTPSAGAIDTVENLVNGVVFSQALPRYQSAILGTMPGLYQLLPRSRHRPVLSANDHRPVDIMDPRTWSFYRWGLVNPSQHSVISQLLPNVPDPAQQQRIAYDHLNKCLARAKAFHAAMDVPAKPPTGTTIHLIAGDAYPTSSQVIAQDSGHISVASKLPGDGKVTRASALMDERYTLGTKWSPRLVSPINWSSVNFLFTDHLGLTKDPSFTDNVLYLLLEAPR